MELSSSAKRSEEYADTLSLISSSGDNSVLTSPAAEEEFVWDQRLSLAPPPYQGAYTRLVRGLHIGDDYVDSLPASAVMCHGSLARERIKMQPQPEWVNWNSVREGQRIFMDHLGQSFIALSLSLLHGFSIGRFGEVLILNGYAQSAETAFERYRETGFAVVDWMRHPLDDENSKAIKQIYNVRAMHSFARRNSHRIIIDKQTEGIPLSQFDMAEVQLAFAGKCPFYLRQEMGVSISDEERGHLCHTWRLIGYHLGILDEYNACNSLQDMDALLKDNLTFLVERNKTCRPSTFALQRTALEGFGQYSGVGTEFFVAMVHRSCEVRGDSTDHLQQKCLPGMKDFAGSFFSELGNKNDRLNRFLSFFILHTRDAWDKHYDLQKRISHFMVYVSKFHDWVVWRMVGHFYVMSAMKRMLLGVLLGFALCRRFLRSA